MTDQELTDAAGRALGWVDYHEDSNECGAAWYLEADKAPFGRVLPKSSWRPLEDDGDTFRLATDMDFSIVYIGDSVYVFGDPSAVTHEWSLVKPHFSDSSMVVEPTVNGKAKATRRAVTRAAAERGAPMLRGAAK